MRDLKVELFRHSLSCLPTRIAIALEFRARVGYRAQLSQPRTFNEKLQYRKLHWRNELFAECSDKVRMRDYVKTKVGSEYLIPLIFEGERLDSQTLDGLLASHPRVVIKVSNDQGSVVKVNSHFTQSERVSALEFIQSRQRSSNRFGMLRNEGWYSLNAAKILVELDLADDDADIDDYKIHCFPQSDGSVQQVLAVDFDRNNAARSRTFYDNNLNILPIAHAAFANKQRPCPLSNAVAEQLFDVAAVLAKPFSYVRVDFFYVQQRAYVGELTFAPGSGFTKFSANGADFLLGKMWQGDPAE